MRQPAIRDTHKVSILNRWSEKSIQTVQGYYFNDKQDDTKLANNKHRLLLITSPAQALVSNIY